MNELITQALILDMLQESGLIDQNTVHDTLDQLVEQQRQRPVKQDD